jgi:hypothetical protein
MLRLRAHTVLDHHAHLGPARMLAPPGRAPCCTRALRQSQTRRTLAGRHCPFARPWASACTSGVATAMVRVLALTHPVQRRSHWVAGTAVSPHQQAHRRRWRGRHRLRQRAAGRLLRLRAARRRSCAAQPVARLCSRRRGRAGRERAGRVRRRGRRRAAHDARRERPGCGDRVRLGQVEQLVRRQDQAAGAAHPARRRARALRAGRGRMAPGGAGVHRIGRY